MFFLVCESVVFGIFVRLRDKGLYGFFFLVLGVCFRGFVAFLLLDLGGLGDFLFRFL